jgi:hypothetical protein
MPKMFLNLKQDYLYLRSDASGEYLIFLEQSPDFRYRVGLPLLGIFNTIQYNTSKVKDLISKRVVHYGPNQQED